MQRQKIKIYKDNIKKVTKPIGGGKRKKERKEKRKCPDLQYRSGRFQSRTNMCNYWRWWDRRHSTTPGSHDYWSHHPHNFWSSISMRFPTPFSKHISNLKKTFKSQMVLFLSQVIGDEGNNFTDPSPHIRKNKTALWLLRDKKKRSRKTDNYGKGQGGWLTAWMWLCIQIK